MKIQSIQYNAALAITGTIRGWILKDRRWLRRLCYLHKGLSTKLSTYLYGLIPPVLSSHRNPGRDRVLY